MKPVKQFAVIQQKLRNGDRTYFVKESEAEQEARDILERKKRYPNYEPPDKLLIVKVVGVVEVSSKRRKVRASDTEDDDSLDLVFEPGCAGFIFARKPKRGP